MAQKDLNLLISSFAGLGLPQTLVLPVSRTDQVSDVWNRLRDELPPSCDRLLLTTASNRHLSPTSCAPVSTYTTTHNDEFLSLRLSAPLCGGKGGFGSQLRAAGGRMSSRKKRNQGDEDGSSRNLDGRRIRTVTEAKALAEYLAIKPEMEQREKEKRRERWEQIVEMAERREHEIKNGTGGRMDEKWVEDKEESVDMIRNAVQASMQSKNAGGRSVSTSSSVDSAAEESDGSAEKKDNSGSKASTPPSDLDGSDKGKGKEPEKPRTLFGFDEDDEFMSSDSEEE
ncbi:uncharacterized protein DNG_08453 [Cephalotrichum gorgonifer]|uniref:Sde2 N-terminal ubiquitin domain-containing protein n=1 Tax=Cephalotrichum gorgonifer TaxID=2041049 RepID=A0AAE8N3J8_9PEZI|nr:uncharacterized protein DNG_08453 [Cephalotrichum gorgonifer]